MYILPEVKKYNLKEGKFIFNSKVTVGISDGIYSQGLNLLKHHLNPFGFEIIKSVKPCLNADVLHISDSEKKEYYKIDISDKRIKILCTDSLSFRNAISTIIALMTSEKGIFSVPCCEIEDYADYPYRGFMLDVARQYIDIELIKERIVLLAKAKYTVMHIHLFDTERYAIKSEAVPALNVNPIFRQYTKDEMKELVAYAKSFGITLLPEIDLPGHGLYVLEALPELKCVQEGKPVGIWDVCVSNRKTYEIIDLLVEELTTIFDCDYIHMGGDELSFYDMKDSGYWPAWYECDRCRKLAEKNGYKTASDYYCHFVRKVYDIVKSHGKKLMIWNDSVDISKSPDLPRDILIHFWRVAVETRGPHDGCSMQRFLEEGFNVVNSFYEETYADDYISESRLAKWTPISSPEIDLKYSGKVLGGEICAWGIRNHFDYTLPSNLFLFANRVYNHKPTDLIESRAALSRQLLCSDIDYLNIFEILGGCLIPLSAEKKFCEDAEQNLDKVNEAIEKTTRKLAEGRYDALILKPIINCLEELKYSLTVQKKEDIENGR